MATNDINNGINTCHNIQYMAITSAIAYGNNICHYICGPKYATIIKYNVPKIVVKNNCHRFRYNKFHHDIWLNICHNMLWQMGVQYCKTHIFLYIILVIIILGKHFAQTRRSLDRDQVKACLLIKN